MNEEQKKTVLNEHQALFNEWVHRLGLDGWHLIFNDMCRLEDLPIKDSSGTTTWVSSTRCAVIDIVDPQFLSKYGVGREFDFETVLVHELLHCVFSLLDNGNDNDNVEDRVLHQIIDDLARALVDAKRNGGVTQPVRVAAS